MDNLPGGMSFSEVVFYLSNIMEEIEKKDSNKALALQIAIAYFSALAANEIS